MSDNLPIIDTENIPSVHIEQQYAAQYFFGPLPPPATLGSVDANTMGNLGEHIVKIGCF
jgi:hypothetical protein